MKKNKSCSIRNDEQVLQKFHDVAQYEDRSASRKIMFLINSCIRSFEEKHGQIELPENTEK